jgi:hypothetical protein
MGVDVYEPPAGSREGCLASIFGDFSDFVLSEERDACVELLESDLRRGGRDSSVGELQGGSDVHPIYRVSFPPSTSSTSSVVGRGGGRGGRDHHRGGNGRGTTKAGRKGGGNKTKAPDNNAAVRLLDMYNRHRGGSGRTLTTSDIEQFMLSMCSRRAIERGTSTNYHRLGNLMLVVQFGGPTPGQVRHIDNMVPNLQICMYMSRNCPSTIVYAIDDDEDRNVGSPVTDGASLLELWQRQRERRREGGVPYLVETMLLKYGSKNLGTLWHTRYFARWGTIDAQLLCFGRLYQPVSRALSLTVEPGTTLLAGGNEVHGGPPTTGSRMFAFAIGIPEGGSDGVGGEGAVFGENGDGGENDGEVQYSPVLLHIDFCCILFGMLDFEHHECGVGDVDDSACREAKRFLVDVLIDLIRDYPMRQYLVQIDEERVGVRRWLDRVLERLEDGLPITALAEEAVDSEGTLYSPEVIKRRSCRKKKARPKSTR